MILFAASTSTIPIWIVLGYLVLLLGLGIFSSTFFRGTSKDYFVASRSIGSFMLLMSVFGTTMTGFALVGSSGKAFTTGVATYGAVAAWSGIIHSAIFFIIGLRLWAIGKRHGYVTQVQFFRDRFNSQTLGTVLFVLLVLLIIPYLLIGIISAGKFVQGTTHGEPMSTAELEAYCDRLKELAAGGGQIREVHLYTVARPTPEAFATKLEPAELESMAATVRERTGLTVAVFP